MKKKTGTKPTTLAPGAMSVAAREIWTTLGVDAFTPDRRAVVREAMQAMDRADECRRTIAAEGMTVGGGKMKHSHPLLKVEAEARAAFMACMKLSGLGTEASRRRLEGDASAKRIRAMHRAAMAGVTK